MELFTSKSNNELQRSTVLPHILVTGTVTEPCPCFNAAARLCPVYAVAWGIAEILGTLAGITILLQPRDIVVATVTSPGP